MKQQLLLSVLLFTIRVHTDEAFPLNPAAVQHGYYHAVTTALWMQSKQEQEYDPNDPRAFRRMKRKQDDLEQQQQEQQLEQRNQKQEQNRQQNQQRNQQQQQNQQQQNPQQNNPQQQEQQQQNPQQERNQAASASMDLPPQPLVKTIGGGTAMIFAMARKMAQDGDEQPRVAPRWHPGIATLNAPIMNQQGYAGIIWKNVRKRNKPSMHRYALRTFDRMVQQQLTSEKKTTAEGRVERTKIHYEGALGACAKLGLWEKAFEIFNEIIEKEARLSKRLQASASQKQLPVHLTDSMVGSIIRACVRAARKSKQRKPLDAAVKLLQTIPSKHGITLEARHINPIAAAYQSLGLNDESANLIQNTLKNRIRGPEPENGPDEFNIHDVGAKDKASYSLLVHSAVSEEDWAGAVDALRNMTESGLYPCSRHLNAWTEVSERKTKHRTTRSRKKKRDEYWLDSVR